MHFIPYGKAESLWDLKTKALHDLLVATGGNLYPFVTIAKHLLESERQEHLKNVIVEIWDKDV